jgi:hypothetical protein
MITQAYQKAESKPVRVMLRLYTLMLLCSAAISPLALTIFNSSFVKYWLAAVLFELCLYPTYRYFKYSESGVPTLPLLSLAYAFQFALPVFTHEPVMPVINSFVELDDAKVQYALLMAIAGMVFLQAGFYLIRAKGVIRSLPTARLRLNTRKALLFCIGIFAFSFLLRVGESLIIERVGVSINSIIGLLQNQILVAIAILGWLVYSNRGGRWHKVLLWTIVAVAMVRGSATSMMESMLLPVMVLFTTKCTYDFSIASKRQFPNDGWNGE